MSDFMEMLAKPSKFNYQAIIKETSLDKKKFDELISISKTAKFPISWRSTWMAWKAARQHPEWFQPHVDFILKKCPKAAYHTEKGIYLRILVEYNFNTEESGDLVDDCIALLYSDKYPQYVKIEAMKLLEKISGEIPELKSEVVLVLEEILPTFEKKYMQKKVGDFIKKLSEK